MNEDKQLHRLFEGSVLLKGAHAVVECCGGLALLAVPTRALASGIERLTHNEILSDPSDWLASHLIAWSQGFSVETQHFYALYLLSHGLVKVVLVTGLLRKQHWAYPASIIALAAFIAFQLERFVATGSTVMLLLSLFDLAVIWLIVHEYRRVRREPVPLRSG